MLIASTQAWLRITTYVSTKWEAFMIKLMVGQVLWDYGSRYNVADVGEWIAEMMRWMLKPRQKFLI